ncbi:Lrp/AsnC ligand binding domain-containing protein [Gordonia sp. (in: high G+C Gram-positive bacteria)]|uniref:Lrp/AsnC ligand binding domain-containing protein n=1 Tax=Gordonia sp. (in: high G+C Gram-positive bacteria) TaxID=84139 RepID=UPI003C756F9F
MHAADHVTLEAFESAVIDIDNVLQAQRLFGDPDYLLRVATRDLPAFNSCTTTVSPASPGCSGSAPPL